MRLPWYPGSAYRLTGKSFYCVHFRMIVWLILDVCRHRLPVSRQPALFVFVPLGMRWMKSTGSEQVSQADYFKPPILKREKRKPVKVCPKERTKTMSAEELSETNSGSLNMVPQISKRCQLLPTAI